MAEVKDLGPRETVTELGRDGAGPMPSRANHGICHV
jgi:hypothetical protein